MQKMMQQVVCTVDVVLLTLQDSALKVALLKRGRAPFKDVQALPGGYIHPDTDADTRDAALRMLAQKTAIQPPYLEQLATFSGPARDPRGWSISVVYYALVPFDVIGQAGQADVTLASVDKLPRLSFDHRAIVNTAVQRLRGKSQYSSLPCYLAGEAFTLPQLQRIYEALMGEALNKVSFRRKMVEMDMLEAIAGEFSAAGAHRPAQLYRLKPELRDQLTLIARGL